MTTRGVDAGGRHVFVGRAASFGGFELTAACGLEHRAALLDDVAHALRFQLDDLVVHQAAVTAQDAFTVKPR